MNAILSELTAAPDMRSSAAVKHALAVRSALFLHNYHSLFRLYGSAPNMGGYIMDQFIARERLAALRTICRAYRPSVPVSHLTSLLAFETGADCVKSLQEADLVLVENCNLVDTKASMAKISER